MKLVECCQIAVAQGIMKLEEAIKFIMNHHQFSQDEFNKLLVEYSNSNYDMDTFCYTVINNEKNNSFSTIYISKLESCIKKFENYIEKLEDYTKKLENSVKELKNHIRCLELSK